MPKALEQRLKATAKRRHYSKERANAYVYGTLYKIKQEQARKKKKKR